MRSEALLWFIRGLGLAVGVVVVLAFAGGLVVAAKVVVLVIISILLAAGLEPVIAWLRVRTPLGRSATILAVFAGFFALMLLLVFLIVPSAIEQSAELGTKLPPLLENVRAWSAELRPTAVGDSINAIVDLADRALRSGAAATPDPDDLIEAGVTLADVVISVITVVTLVFFWLTGHQRLQRFFLSLLPPEPRAGAREAWNEVETRLGMWVRGQLILMSTLFLMTTIAYFLIGLEGALLLGLIAGIAEAIPIVGPALGAVPALLVAALTGRVEVILLVAVVYVVIQIVEGNILVPIVMKNTIGVPPFLVIVSLITGATIAGIVGALLAVPLTAAGVVILERLQARDSPVPIESQAPETPTAAAAEQMARRLPDARGSAGSR
jgi:predicted PurR-regulated permease PerM